MGEANPGLSGVEQSKKGSGEECTPWRQEAGLEAPGEVSQAGSQRPETHTHLPWGRAKASSEGET